MLQAQPATVGLFAFWPTDERSPDQADAPPRSVRPSPPRDVDARPQRAAVHSISTRAPSASPLQPNALRASAMAQHVRNEGASDPTLGRIPTNVPNRSVKLLADYAVAALPGLSVLANLAYEGPREVFRDDAASIPGWTRWDLGARYTQSLGGSTLTWRAGVDNLFDRRAWREAPYQYDHAYLFPIEPRTFHASIEAKF